MFKIILSIFLFFSFLSFGCANNCKEVHKQNIEIKNLSFLEATQKKLLEEHNKQRKIKNLKELSLDQKLCNYAQKHAEEMARKNSLYHSQISNINWSNLVGENIAFGQERPKEVMSAWMLSPGHKSNILGQKYQKVGFGISKDKNERVYWCTVFTN